MASKEAVIYKNIDNIDEFASFRFSLSLWMFSKLIQ